MAAKSKRLVNIQATVLLTNPIPYNIASKLGKRRRGRRGTGTVFPAFIHEAVIDGDKIAYLLFPERARVVISGSDSIETLNKAIKYLLQILRRHGYEGEVVEYRPHSFNTSFELPRAVDLDCAQRVLQEAYPDATIIYEPESLPHLRMYREGYATLILTVKGKGWVIGKMRPEKESEYIDEIADVLEACYS